MSGGNKQVQTSQNSLPDWLTTPYQGSLASAQALDQAGGPQIYGANGQQTVANFSPLQNIGLASIAGTAMGPSATQGAEGWNQYATSGALLDPNANPYLQANYNQALQGEQNNIASEFGAAGRNVISSLPVQQQGAADLANQLYGSAYNSGLQATTQAAAQAPSLDQSMYLPGEQLYTAGAQQQQQQQNQLNSTANIFNYQQELPYNTEGWYQGLLGQIATPYQQNTTTTQNQGNPWAGALGGALTGAEAGSTMGPWGAVGGGLLGGTAGYFGSK